MASHDRVVVAAVGKCEVRIQEHERSFATCELERAFLHDAAAPVAMRERGELWCTRTAISSHKHRAAVHLAINTWADMKHVAVRRRKCFPKHIEAGRVAPKLLQSDDVWSVIGGVLDLRTIPSSSDSRAGRT